MPEIVPFPALRFTDMAGDLSLLLAPPYDVIDSADAIALRERSEHNCVRLILPDGSPDERYLDAAEILRRWIDEGVLAADPDPSAYVYRQRFEVDGEELERLALFAAVRLSPFDAGEILPHERTHADPRSSLMPSPPATSFGCRAGPAVHGSRLDPWTTGRPPAGCRRCDLGSVGDPTTILARRTHADSRDRPRDPGWPTMLRNIMSFHRLRARYPTT